MSRTPSEHSGHPTSDRSSPSLCSRPHQADQMPTAYHQPLPRHESWHFLPQNVGPQGPGFTGTSVFPLPASGYPQDPSYVLSTDHRYAHRTSLPHTLPLRMHHHDAAIRDPQHFPSGQHKRLSPRPIHDRKVASLEIQ